MRLTGCVISGPGKIRTMNQDNYYLDGIYGGACTGEVETHVTHSSSGCGLYAVADGMGGERFGEVAALAAVRFMDLIPRPVDIPAFQEYLIDCNRDICQFMRDNGNIRSGSTFVGISIRNGSADIINIGDSRAYLLREGCLRQISQDHTQVRQLIDMGILTPEAARTHSGRHTLTQHLGIFPEEMIIEPFAIQGTVASGDLFLLCSDGVHDMLSDETIQTALSRPGSVEEQARRLFDLAMEAGGKDNITVLLVGAEEES